MTKPLTTPLNNKKPCRLLQGLVLNLNNSY
nr:MAG TPA: hypothetical protein [Caudoviricetes sp.]